MCSLKAKVVWENCWLCTVFCLHKLTGFCSFSRSPCIKTPCKIGTFSIPINLTSSPCLLLRFYWVGDNPGTRSVVTFNRSEAFLRRNARKAADGPSWSLWMGEEICISHGQRSFEFTQAFLYQDCSRTIHRSLSLSVLPQPWPATFLISHLLIVSSYTWQQQHSSSLSTVSIL